MRCHTFYFALCFTLFSPLSISDEAVPDYVQQARQTTMLFQSRLKQSLMSAMKSGGPQRGVEVCSKQAKQIAEELGKKTGWRVRRVAFKTRNSENKPGVNEQRVLKYFSAQLSRAAGERELEWWQENPSERSYAKAIRMDSICLTCHGSNIDPSLKATIQKFYPADTATGFELYELRGAFFLNQPLEKHSEK